MLVHNLVLKFYDNPYILNSPNENKGFKFFFSRHNIERIIAMYFV
jgi:hypothetical protein